MKTSGKWAPSRLQYFWPLVISLLYLATYLIRLTALPVFADESIYIRWAQLIIDDPAQYLFFPMNDGKTPLFIWLLVPFLKIFSDPLFAGRFLSVLVGLAQIWVIYFLLKAYHAKSWTKYLGMLLGTILPYWFFHQRMALMDGMLSLLISLTWLQTINISQHLSEKLLTRKQLIRVSIAGLFFGLGFLTKIPIILFTPAILMGILINSHYPLFSKTNLKKGFFYFSSISLLGLGIFGLLKLHPAFGQLFNRGGDFLFSFEELIMDHKWRDALSSWLNYLNYFSTYLTWPVVYLSVLGLVFGQRKKQLLKLNAAWFIFALPMLLMGRVVYARYLLPVAVFFTLASVITIEELIPLIKRSFGSQKLFKLAFLLLLLPIFINSAQFISNSWSSPAKLNLVSSDQTQYLTSWSAGYGIKPAYRFLSQLAENEKLLIATEGYFGTLPDALLMYFHQQDVSNIYITGIGQPVHRLPQSVISRTDEFDRVLLVVNEHRLMMNMDRAKLLREDCRPLNAPCQQIWDVTPIANSN